MSFSGKLLQFQCFHAITWRGSTAVVGSPGDYQREACTPGQPSVQPLLQASRASLTQYWAWRGLSRRLPASMAGRVVREPFGGAHGECGRWLVCPLGLGRQQILAKKLPVAPSRLVCAWSPLSMFTVCRRQLIARTRGQVRTCQGSACGRPKWAEKGDGLVGRPITAVLRLGPRPIRARFERRSRPRTCSGRRSKRPG